MSTSEMSFSLSSWKKKRKNATYKIVESWMSTKFGSQQKTVPRTTPEEGGPIPLHRDTTIFESEYVQQQHEA